jgi:NADPH-dependent curcumin reductase
MRFFIPAVTPKRLSSITTHHQVRLAKRPVGMPTRENWAFTSEPVQPPSEGY